MAHGGPADYDAKGISKAVCQAKNGPVPEEVERALRRALRDLVPHVERYRNSLGPRDQTLPSANAAIRRAQEWLDDLQRARPSSSLAAVVEVLLRYAEQAPQPCVPGSTFQGLERLCEAEEGPIPAYDRDLERDYVPRVGERVHDREADRDGDVVFAPGVYGADEVYLRPSDGARFAGGWAAKIDDIELVRPSVPVQSDAGHAHEGR